MKLNPINASVAIARAFFETHGMDGDLDAFDIFFAEIFKQSPALNKATLWQIRRSFYAASSRAQCQLDPDYFYRIVFDFVSRSEPIEHKDILMGLFLAVLIDSFRLNDQDQEQTDLVSKARNLATKSGLISKSELDQQIPRFRAIHEFAATGRALSALEDVFD